MISTNQFKNGMTIKLDGALFTILEFQHVKPGKGGAFVRTRLKNLKLGTVKDKTFRAGELVEEAFIEEKKLLYSYKAGEEYHFMDQATYEDILISKDELSEAKGYLKENSVVGVALHKGRIVGVILPNFVELRVKYTEPGLRGDTVQGGTKPAKLETGLACRVPLFINQGDVIKIDTRTGGYVSRV